MRRVAITRAANRLGRYRDALGALGVELIPLPVTASEDASEDDLATLRRELTGLVAGDLVVVPSVRSAQAVLLAWPEFTSNCGVIVAAVGDASAAPLRAHGLTVCTPRQATAVGLVDELGPIANLRRVVWPRAAEALPTLGIGLRDAGADVVDVIVYRTTRTALDDPDLDAALTSLLRGVDALLCFAPSQVDALCAALVARQRSLGGLARHLIAIGPTTAAAFAAAGVGECQVAASPTPDALVACLSAALELD